MKKSNKFLRFVQTIPAKLWLILIAIVVFAFFSNDFGLVDIQKTAVILAAGVDKNGDGGYKMTAQIAVPKGVDRTTGGTSSVNFTAEGETIADCVSDIYCKTGWVPKFIFCNLLLIGEEAATENVFGALDFFLRNEYMPDSCYVAVCEGTAEEMISSESAIDDTSSLAITRLFSDATIKSGKATKMSLKEFSIGYHGPGKSGYMPYVIANEQEGADTQGGGGSQSGTEQKKQKAYCAERTALFYEGKQVALLGSDETFAFGLLNGDVTNGYLLCEEEGKAVTLSVLEDKGGVKLSTKGTPKAELKIELTVRLFNRAVAADIDDVAKSYVSDEVKENAKQTVLKAAENVFEISRESGCDLFNLNRSLYRSSKQKYEEWKDTLLATVPATYEVKINAVK